MKKSIIITIYNYIELNLEYNDNKMYEVFTIDNMPLGEFDPYLCENWDWDDPTIDAEIVENLIEAGELYFPYTDDCYYASAA